MTDIRKFPVIFEEIVAEVRKEWDAENNVLPISEFGTYLQLTEAYSLKDKEESKKYPLIWLVWEASESERNYEANLIALIKPRLFVVNFTDENYSSSERYAANFETVLYPLWDLFLEKMNEHNQLGKIYKEDYRDYDHLYWGSTVSYQKKKNVIFDKLDAFEVKFTNDIRILPGAC